MLRAPCSGAVADRSGAIVVTPDGSVTAGNASGVNDGACALLLADEATAGKYGLTPKARVVGMATAGVPPRVMGIGPAPATEKVLALTGLKLDQIDVKRPQRFDAAALVSLEGTMQTTSLQGVRHNVSVALQYLAAAGVGTIGVVDDDVVSELDQLLHGLRGRRDAGFSALRLLGHAKSHRHSWSGVVGVVGRQPTTAHGRAALFVTRTMLTPPRGETARRVESEGR